MDEDQGKWSLMAQFPAIPLFTDAYLGDTTHLTTIEHGAYLLLLMTMWRAGGSLPSEDRMLTRYTKLRLDQWRKMKPVIMEFFEEKDGKITQKRLTDELGLALQRSAGQAHKAKARWLKNKETHDAAASAQHKPQQNHGNASQTQTHIGGGGGARARDHAPTHTREDDPPTESLVSMPDDAVALYESVMAACGVRNDITPTYWMPPTAIIEVARWRGLGLTDEEIIEVAKGSRRAKREPPNGPKALERFMAIAASVKADRRSKSLGEGHHDRHSDNGSEALRRSLERAAKPDKGLDFW